jgi:hypothetical protein
MVFNEIESADEPVVLPDGLEGEPRSERHIQYEAGKVVYHCMEIYWAVGNIFPSKTGQVSPEAVDTTGCGHEGEPR